ncbi:Acyl-CoA dehydrogenase [subsurface metagenome]
MVKTDPERGARGISAIIVEKDAPGFKRGITLDKMGFRGLQVGELIFENCTVPEENLLGKEGLGFIQAMKVLEQGRVAVAGVGVAIAQACLEEAVARSKKRIQFGKPISSFQLIQKKLSDMKTRIDASRLLTYKAAWLISNNKPCAIESSVAKLFSSETANFCADEAVQIFGGYGYIKKYKDKYRLERMYRDAKLLEIAEGTSEIQRMIISRHLTR